MTDGQLVEQLIARRVDACEFIARIQERSPETIEAIRTLLLAAVLVAVEDARSLPEEFWSARLSELLTKIEGSVGACLLEVSLGEALGT